MQTHTQILGQQTSLFTGDNATSLLEGSRNHASLTAQQGSDWEKKMTAISGQRCVEQFGRFPRAGSWAKTFAALLIGMEVWSSTRCRLTWKLRATKCSRFYFLLQVSTPLTEGIGSGLWQTPLVNDAVNRKFSVNSRGEPKLQGQAKLGYPATGKNWMLPTPQVFDATALFIKRSGYNGQNSHSEKLGNAIERHMGTTGETSQLNPRFVLEMMGFPPNWTELPFLTGAKNQSKPPATP